MSGSIRIKHINHVGIPIWDRRVSLPFYRDVLGLRVIPSMVDLQNIVWTATTDGTMVHLVEPTDGENLANPHAAFEVEDFDGAVGELRDSGFPGMGEPGERHDGQRYVSIFDNDGNRIEFTTASGLLPSNRVVDALGYTGPGPDAGENASAGTGTNAGTGASSRPLQSLQVRRINHVGLPVTGRDSSMPMYRDLLNIAVIPHQANGNTLAWLELADGSMVHLIDPPESVGPRGDTRQHVAFEVADIEAAIDALELAEVEIADGPGTRHDGQQYIFIYDPDGNRIEIATRGHHADTARTVDENGYTGENGRLL